MKKVITRSGSLVLLFLFSNSLFAAELSGKVAWLEPLTLSTNLAAEVIQAVAPAGQRVKKGDLLVQLEDGVLRARLSQASAELAHQKLLLTEAGNELQRSEELYDRTLLSDHDLDLARIAHAAADSSYQRATAELKTAQQAVGLSRIIAPFDALVLERHVQSGETVNGQYQSRPLYTLVALQKRQARFVVDATQALQLHLDDELELQIGKQRYTGRVGAINRYSAKAADITIDVIFTLAEGDALVIGDTAQLTLP